jgi:Icc-related predicted phosphoesterase
MSSGSDRKRTWANISDATDILITHSPPFGILDSESVADGHQGCLPLMEAVLRVRPRLHVFGHIHGGYGTKHNEHTLFVNAALYDDLGGVERPPIIVDFDALRKSFDR